MRNIIALISLITLTACSKSNSTAIPISIEVDSITFSSTGAQISWSYLSTGEGKDTFDVYLNNQLKAKGISKNTFSYANLTPNTKYTGKVVLKAANENTAEDTFSFTTRSNSISGL